MSYRLDKLRSILKEKELDALLVSTSENRRYLSGFHGSAGSLLVSGEDAFLATDFRYVEQAANQAPEFQVLKVGAGWSWLMDLLKDTGLKKVGFESQQVTVATYQQMVEAVRDVPAAEQPSLVATSSIVEELRTVKDGDELEMMQRAVDVADAAMDSVTPTVQAWSDGTGGCLALGGGYAKFGSRVRQLRNHRSGRSQWRHAPSQALRAGHRRRRACCH